MVVSSRLIERLKAVEDERLQKLEASAVEEAAGDLVDFDAVIARL
jgi:hypothetical protein